MKKNGIAQSVMSLLNGSTQQPSTPPKAETQYEMFDRIAKERGVTTWGSPAPNGGTLVWVSALEVDPVTALMSAALQIMVRRGTDPDASSGITLKKMAVAAVGAEYFWQVTGVKGEVLGSGYCATEHEAAQNIAGYMRMRPGN